MDIYIICNIWYNFFNHLSKRPIRRHIILCKEYNILSLANIKYLISELTDARQHRVFQTMEAIHGTILL
ncbi:MAG: hypothetical protein K0R84_1441 [Clostridia bacterium]|nr:hypothetical protein [Clostridia bacterium]